MRCLPGPPTCSPVVDLQEGQVGLGSDLSLLILCGVGVLEKQREMGRQDDVRVKKTLKPCFFVPFRTPDLVASCICKRAKLKRWRPRASWFPQSPSGFSKVSIKGFFLKENSKFFVLATFESWVLVKVGLGLLKLQPPTHNAPGQRHHPKISLLGDYQDPTLPQTCSSAPFPPQK